jgi:hypothetical protein
MPVSEHDGVASENGSQSTLSPGGRPQGPEFSCADLGAAAPEAVARQVDVFPAQRRQERQQGLVVQVAGGAQRGEAFGSWLGRTAARFRIGVDDLIAASELEVEIGQDAQAWLAARPKTQAAVMHLSALARLPAQEIEEAVPKTQINTTVYVGCYHCLIMNPWEVESPYWRRCWIEEEPVCLEAAHVRISASVALLRRHRNMKRLVNEISLRERRRRDETAASRVR